MAQKIITIVGGTGFVGRYIVRRLAAAGYTLCVVCRHPEAGRHLQPAGHAGQIVLLPGDLARPDTLSLALEHAQVVINLVGVLFESGKQRFATLHVKGAGKLAEMAKAAGAERFIHLSALGADKAYESRYAQSKLAGEEAVLAAFPEATIFRPSIVFGPEDNFFNLFATMASLSPALPLIGGGRTRFQPVYAGDVAKAVDACLMRPETMGRTFELGGPQIYAFRQILEYIMDVTGKKRPLLPLPFGVAALKAVFAQYLPPPFRFTPDQIKLLHYDNVVSLEALTFADLGIQPTAMEMVVPQYLSRFRKKMAA